MEDLNTEAKIPEFEDQARVLSKANCKDENFCYAIHGKFCSHPEVVGCYLDSGVLVNMKAKAESTMLAIPKKEQELENHLRDPCYVYVLLGACAMTLGCHLPASFTNMLKKVYTEGGLMPEALKQMRKALFGPHGYQNGHPYDFGSKSVMETMNSKDEDRKPNKFGFIGMNVPSPGGLFNTGMGNSWTSKIIKELRDKHNKPDVCAGCGAEAGKGGKSLLVCSTCKDRKYCSRNCQKKHWAIHKKLCEPAATIT